MKDYHCLINERVHYFYWNENLNCAITTLKILSEIFEIDLCPQVLNSTIGMLDAGRLGAWCGLIEGSLMFFGILGKERCYENKTIVNWCYDFSGEFKKLFGSLVCRELRPQGFRPENPPHLCEELTEKAIELAANYVYKITNK